MFLIQDLNLSVELIEPDTAKNLRLKTVKSYLITIVLLFSAAATTIAQQNDQQLAIQYYQNRDYDKALVLFEGFYEKDPSLFNYIYYLNLLIEKQQFDKAEKIVKKQNKAQPNDPRYQVDYGYVFMMEGEREKGKKQYDDCIKNLKPDKNQIVNLANSFINRRENDYAIKTYQKGRELIGSTAAFAFELAALYETLGSWSGMIDEYFVFAMNDQNQVPTIQSRLQYWLSDDPENTRHDLFRTKLLEKNQKEPDELFYAEMLLWYSIQEKDFTMAMAQAKSLDRRFAEDGLRVFNLALLSASNDDNEVAVDGFNYVIRKNANDQLVMQSRIELLNTRLKIATSGVSVQITELRSLENDYHKILHELGENASTVMLIKNLAHLQAFYLNEPDSAIVTLEKTLSIPGQKPSELADCKLELADIYLISGDQWEATLLYSQVEKSFKNEPIGHEAKLRNARLMYYIGEFDWAKSQLDILKAATSKLIANDAMELSLMIEDNIAEDSISEPLLMYARADLLVFRNQLSQAVEVLDSIEKKFPSHPINDDVLFKKAEIAEKEMNFSLAGKYYTELVQGYPTDLLADDAIFRLAVLYETRLNDKAKAMELYQSILKNYSDSLYVVEARKRFRALRGESALSPENLLTP